MKKLLSIITLFLYLSTIGQNLVPNPSFETYTMCPNNGDEAAFAPPWKTPTAESPDYFNICDTAISIGGQPYGGIPYNTFGYQYARSGNAYMGIIVKGGYTDYREYICAPLLSSLISGVKYYASIYISSADTNLYGNYRNYPSDRIGIYLSNGIDTPSINISYGYIHQIPQIENPAGNMLSDTLNWVQISGWFTASGGENYITIGNFRSDSLTMGQADIFNYSYYYIDDVYLSTDSTQETGIKHTTISTNVTIFPNPGNSVIQVSVGKEPLLEVKVFDMLGNEVVESNKTQVDVSSLRNGVYFIRAKTTKGLIKTGKIVIQH